MVYDLGSFSNAYLGYIRTDNVEEINLNGFSQWSFSLFKLYFPDKTFNFITTNVKLIGPTLFFSAFILPYGSQTK